MSSEHGFAALRSPYFETSRSGYHLLNTPLLNKGTAFTEEERDAFDLHGLLPPTVSTLDEQAARRLQAMRQLPNDFERYIFLRGLQDTNEVLFYALLVRHLDELLPIVYTPTVGLGCQHFSQAFRKPRGLFLSIPHQHRIRRILGHPRFDIVEAIVVTDGERILGLGDQGVGGMGIPIGKLALYSACAGIPPALTLPIMLDVGTDNEERLNDPLYLGTRHRRIRGAAYQDFVDHFVDAVIRVFPGAVLQWEDFLKANAIAQLARFRDRLCTFNDDIQGTASVVVAGLYSALRITGQPFDAQRIVLAGAGASAQGIAELLMLALEDAGLRGIQARQRIAMVDSHGLVTRERPQLEEFKAAYARSAADLAGCDCQDASHITLEETVRFFRPTILIGTSGTPRLFSKAVVEAMAAVNDRPIVLPLSNPTSNSECTAAEAIAWSGGRAIVATGSPFEPVDYNGRRFQIGQGNNAFIFPGVGLGLWIGSIRRVTDVMFLAAAKALAREVTPGELDRGLIYPELSRIRDCSQAVACAVIRRAIAEGYALPIAGDVEADVLGAMWTPQYFPVRYEPHRARYVLNERARIEAILHGSP